MDVDRICHYGSVMQRLDSNKFNSKSIDSTCKRFKVSDRHFGLRGEAYSEFFFHKSCTSIVRGQRYLIFPLNLNQGHNDCQRRALLMLRCILVNIIVRSYTFY